MIYHCTQLLVKRDKKSITWDILCFFALFFILSLRTPEDLFSAYLWAEDGAELIQGSIFSGAHTLTTVGNGAYWTAPKAISLICYQLSCHFGILQYLPQIQGICCKLLATACIFWFTSDKFEWLVGKKIVRSAICIGIILMIPQEAQDLMTCDTSIPFMMNFAVFLMGVYYFCNKEVRTPSILQSCFLVLTALSSIAAPFVAAVALLAWIRWFMENRKNHVYVQWSAILIECFKLFIVLLAVFIQVRCVILSNRASSNLELIKRILLNMKYFIFFPYWDRLRSWFGAFLGISLWLVILRFTKFPRLFALFCFCYSFAYLLFCSMMTTAEEFYKVVICTGYRFSTFSYMVATLALGVALDSANKCEAIPKSPIIMVLSIILLIGITKYHISVIGMNFSELYSEYIPLFKEDGSELLHIPVGPWDPWRLTIPTTMSDKEQKNDMSVILYDIGGSSPTAFIPTEDASYTIVKGRICCDSNIPIVNVLQRMGNQYLAAYSLNDDGVFTVHATPEFLNYDTTMLDFIALTADGSYHSGNIEIAAELG